MCNLQILPVVDLNADDNQYVTDGRNNTPVEYLTCMNSHIYTYLMKEAWKNMIEA